LHICQPRRARQCPKVFWFFFSKKNKLPLKNPANRAEALRQLGYQAYRAGKIERASQLFARALALCAAGGQEAGTLLSDLGVSASSLGRDGDARLYHEQALQIRRDLLGSLHPDTAGSLHNLGVACRKLGDFERAAALHHEAIAVWRSVYGPDHPAVAKGLASLGLVLGRTGNWAAALRCHQEALRLREAAFPPLVGDVVASLEDLANARMRLGDYAAARADWQRALTLQQSQFPGTSRAQAPILNGLGTALRRLGDMAGAETCFAAALRADPDGLAARHNLAALLAREGRAAESAVHRDAALRRQSVFVQEATAECCKVLILSGSDSGNVPLEHLLPEATVTRIWWFLAHAGPKTGPNTGETLPPYDVVFNGLGDPDTTSPIEAKVADFVEHCRKPVLNHPERVRRTRRDRLPDLLGDIPHAIVPRTVRLEEPGAGAGLRQSLEDRGVAPPFLLRPPGSHGGTGVIRIDHWEALASREADSFQDWYASTFVDCMAADGFVRKYRVAFVDREPFPYHLAISNHWLVHYFSAEMATHDWKLAEEAAFLADWRGVVGNAAASAIAAVGRRLDMDFCGVDFGIARDGRPVIFEANATMLIHPESERGALAFKNPAVREIIAAMQAMLRRRKDVIV
jgi:tetratricopeptide (TPR) repeat protein